MITLTATITKEDGSLINLNYKNSVSVERTILGRSNISMPSWGIISNTGNLRFIDTDGSIKNLAEQRLLKSGLQAIIYLENTLTSARNQIGEFLTDKWQYDNENRTVSVSLKDELRDWQDIIISPIRYNPYREKNYRCKWLYNYLYELTPSKYNMLPFESLDETTQNILSGTEFEFLVLHSKNLWNGWAQLCQACQCYIHKNNLGQTVFKYTGGN